MVQRSRFEQQAKVCNGEDYLLLNLGIQIGRSSSQYAGMKFVKKLSN